MPQTCTDKPTETFQRDLSACFVIKHIVVTIELEKIFKKYQQDKYGLFSGLTIKVPGPYLKNIRQLQLIQNSSVKVIKKRKF